MRGMATSLATRVLWLRRFFIGETRSVGRLGGTFAKRRAVGRPLASPVPEADLVVGYISVGVGRAGRGFRRSGPRCLGDVGGIWVSVVRTAIAPAKRAISALPDHTRAARRRQWVQFVPGRWLPLDEAVGLKACSGGGRSPWRAGRLPVGVVFDKLGARRVVRLRRLLTFRDLCDFGISSVVRHSEN